MAGTNISVLIIDDTQIIRTRIKRYLEGINKCDLTFNVIEAETYELGISIMSEMVIDVVLIDLQLDGDTYINTIEVIKGSYQANVAGMSNSLNIKELVTSIHSNIDMYMIKAVSVENFNVGLDTLVRVLICGDRINGQASDVIAYIKDGIISVLEIRKG